MLKTMPVYRFLNIVHVVIEVYPPFCPMHFRLCIFITERNVFSHLLESALTRVSSVQ